MKVGREDVAAKLRAYLRHELPLAELVDWAERAMYDGGFDDDDFDAIRCAVAKLGLADVKTFGLTLKACFRSSGTGEYTTRLHHWRGAPETLHWRYHRRRPQKPEEPV